jgi:hypothetical protein
LFNIDRPDLSGGPVVPKIPYIPPPKEIPPPKSVKLSVFVGEVPTDAASVTDSVPVPPLLDGDPNLVLLLI